MSDNVLRFGEAILPGEPVPNVIRTLEGLLEEARRGEVRALAFAVLRPDTATSSGWDGEAGSRNHLSFAISCLHIRFHVTAIETSFVEDSR